MAKKHKRKSKRRDRASRRKEALVERDGTRCYFCGSLLNFDDHDSPSVATEEHLVPRSRGGRTELANLVLACRLCNDEKGSMTEEEYWWHRVQSRFKSWDWPVQE